MRIEPRRSGPSGVLVVTRTGQSLLDLTAPVVQSDYEWRWDLHASLTDSPLDARSWKARVKSSRVRVPAKAMWNWLISARSRLRNLKGGLEASILGMSGRGIEKVVVSDVIRARTAAIQN